VEAVAQLAGTDGSNLQRETAMQWKTPVIIEIAVGLEINAYACAEVK
jgi:coenzyme PQQ precursor peptide PqqA